MSSPVDKIGKIDRPAVTRSSERGATKPEKAGQPPLQDQVELSRQALDLKKLSAAAGNAPDIRPEKVSAVREQLESGTYRVIPELIAERLIEEG